MHKENKNSNFIQQFLLFRVSRCTFMTEPRRKVEPLMSHGNNLNFVFRRWTKVLQVWNGMIFICIWQLKYYNLSLCIHGITIEHLAFLKIFSSIFFFFFKSRMKTMSIEWKRLKQDFPVECTSGVWRVLQSSFFHTLLRASSSAG